MPKNDVDRAIALAGLLQAISLVLSISHNGNADENDCKTCFSSLLKIQSVSSIDIYGTTENIKSGLLLSAKILSNELTDLNITRYMINLMALDKKLAKRMDLEVNIRNSIKEIIENLSQWPLNHEYTIAKFADTYINNISVISPRISLKGVKMHLMNQVNINKIRALLLAGIRASKLWHQSGGSRLILLMRRRTILEETQKMLRN